MNIILKDDEGNSKSVSLLDIYNDVQALKNSLTIALNQNELLREYINQHVQATQCFDEWVKGRVGVNLEETVNKEEQEKKDLLKELQEI